MGYTHYWYTLPNLDKAKFAATVQDLKTVLPKLEHLGIKLAGGLGDGQPVLTDTEICFNGTEKCGHEKRELGITWPSDNASGIAPLAYQHRLGNQSNADVDGHWFAGAKISTRTCGGDCSHETFSLELVPEMSDYAKECIEREGVLFNCTKTAYKPYDLAVNIALIIADHHMRGQIFISSDGTMEQWADAIQICEHFLGYGSDFEFREKPTFTPKAPQIQTTNDKVKPGDVFYSSWGYDQTNIDYYKVLSVSPSGKTCIITPIKSRVLEHTGFMSEKVIPNPDEIKLEREWVGEDCREVQKKYRATIRYDNKNKIWLRCGKTYGGYLWIYDGPNTATHYA